MRTTNGNGHCNAEQTPIYHWETGKVEKAMKQSQDILPNELPPCFWHLNILKITVKIEQFIFDGFLYRKFPTILYFIGSDISIDTKRAPCHVPRHRMTKVLFL